MCHASYVDKNFSTEPLAFLQKTSNKGILQAKNNVNNLKQIIYQQQQFI